MISNKHITKIIAVVMALAVCLCFCTVMYSDQITAAAGDSGITLSYETKLFNTDEIIDINIIISEDDWNDILTNATAEEYHTCDVEVNGTMFYQVAIRTKGNTSLTSIASDPDTDRYSFKLEFDRNIDDQTCFGLDKLILNNNYSDATNMKEALIYDMFQYLGADASLYNYAKVSVNGTYWGVYLALEAVEDSFMLRNYGVQNGELYKPDSLNFANNDGNGSMPDISFDTSSLPGRSDSASDSGSDSGSLFPSNPFGSSSGNSGFGPSSGNSNQTRDTTADAAVTDQTSSDFLPSSGGSNQTDTSSNPSASDQVATSTDLSGFTPPSRDDAPSGSFSFGSFSSGGFGGGGFGGFGFSSGNGTNLNYIDDDVDSYSAIWNSAISKISTKDKQRVVTALKNISEGTSLETYMDTDNILRYLAVHIFSVNEDSLSGSMAHNYYLYEYGGKLNIIPWDYNLALGGMSGGSASSVINSAIDDAFSITNFFDSLLNDETYHSQYYAYLQELVDGYINGGAFDAFYNRVRSQIDELVESDPTAFFTYDEYTTAVEMLYKVVKLRGESISGQVSGEIPSTDSAQRNSSALIDATGIDLSVMGSMNTGNTPSIPDKDNFDFSGFDFNSIKSDGDASATPDAAATSMPSPPGNADFSGSPGGSNASSDSAASDAAATSMPSTPGNADFSASSGGSSASSDSAASDAAATSMPSAPSNVDFSASSGASAQSSGTPPTNGGTAPAGFDASQFSGTMPSNNSASQQPDASAAHASDAPAAPKTSAGSEFGDEITDAPSDEGSDEVRTSGFTKPSGDFSSFSGAFGNSGTSVRNTAVISQNLVNYGICLAVMIVAIIIALLFRRRK